MLVSMDKKALAEIIANRISNLSGMKKTPQSGFVREGIKISQQRVSDWGKTDKVPGSWISLRALSDWYETSVDYILGATDDPSPTPKRELSIDERSILEIMRELSPDRREEVIRLAQVVRDMYQKEDEKSTFDKIEAKYESGDNAPRIVGEESDDPQDNK